MLNRLLSWDRGLFLYLNGKNTSWLDPVMLVFSSFEFWIIVLLSVIGFVLYKSKMKDWAFGLFILMSIGANSLINNIIKHLVARGRPIHVEMWTDVIHAIEDYDTSYSFFSAHSSNSFTLAVFSALYFRNKSYSVCILLWALVVAYSRIYLGKHYPLDVACGIAFGIFMGVLGYKCYEYYLDRRSLRMG